ncbi:MAG TPA: error-prone DNA polymerase [Acidisoma sp.]|uniref:error-prone DNA polymerase n=1 Tax=Acidisoma sp. TaxID=1872115 RepID=UPI002C03B2B4|nr:error-prone DNA polymerase [Acidisoma sp.]HTI03128.1 error-prone DNA polymerase [Acidisoma sp.]
MAYAELQITSNYSFLRGASHVEELIGTAKAQGHAAIGLTDRNSVAGMVRAWVAAQEAGLRLLPGCRLDFLDAPSLLVYPRDRAGWSDLCQLLSAGKARGFTATKRAGTCHLLWQDLQPQTQGLIAASLVEAEDPNLAAHLDSLRALFGRQSYLSLSPRRLPGNARRLHRLAEAGRAAGVALLVTGDVLYHTPERRPLQDVLTAIREHTTIDQAGFLRERYADRHLRAPREMARLLRAYPEAIANTERVLAAANFDLGQIRYQYPSETESGETAQQVLVRQVAEGLPRRYPEKIPPGIKAQIDHELKLIEQLDYAPYFLTVHSIVRYARGQGILCQGRGSAANSAVCFVLGITEIDPVASNLLFERFISAERREPPDIDVDFEHEARETVIQWVYAHYGRARAALCATVMRYRTRGAVRDVGKALGLTEDVTSALASQVWGWSEEALTDENLRALNFNPADQRLKLALSLAETLIGFPRQLGTHPGGFVLTQDRLSDLVPVAPAAMQDRQIIEWDKEDIDVLRFMKVDVLGLGMLGCMRRAFDLLAENKNEALTLATIPQEDKPTYEMISRADTLGTFQIESRAQMAMLPRLKPQTFYDLVIQVAIVRPGPIQGDMVHPYLRRREQKEPVSYPSPALERVLGKTLGVPLFQEQAMQVAIHCAGFTPGEADQLRRSMATFKMTGGVSKFRDQLIEGMVARRYPRDFAEATFRQIEGFGSYGFPESHAASFALIAYASAWMKCHHPEVFAAALLNSQPMGFYAPAQIVGDARAHGVEIRPVSVLHSRWDCTLETRAGGGLALRLGLRMAKGLANEDAARLVLVRDTAPFTSLADLADRTSLPRAALETLAAADAFEGFGLDRRRALWAIGGLADGALPLFAARSAGEAEPQMALRGMTEERAVVEDYRAVGLSLRAHPASFLRPHLSVQRITPCADLAVTRDGARLTVAGLVLVRQRPGSARGVLFVTIEDETGFANAVIWPDVYEAHRAIILGARMLAIRGRVQKEGQVIHVIAEILTDLSPLLAQLGAEEARMPEALARADEVKRGGPGGSIRVPTRDFR